MELIGILFALISLCLCDIRMNGYIKDFFTLQNPLMSQAWTAVTQEYLRQTGQKQDDIYLYPIALYRKYVNGINYKIFFASQIKATNNIQIYAYIAYNGLFSTESAFDIVSIDLLNENKEMFLNRFRYRKLMNTLISKGQLFYENKLLGYQNFLGDCGIYVVYGKRESGSALEGYFIFEDEAEGFSKIAQIIDL